jgi:hypothetical protein
MNINFPVLEGGKKLDVKKRREIRPTLAFVLPPHSFASNLVSIPISLISSDMH